MYQKLLLLSFVIVGLFITVAVFAQTCTPDFPGCASCPPKIYEGINCGSDWYCNGCKTGSEGCFACPRSGEPTGATILNYVSCVCQCPSGQIVCAGACATAPACGTATRVQDNSSCNGCGACKAGYSPDPLNPDPPSPCLKTAYIDYANTGYFQVSGDLKSTGGDLYLASGKAIRIDGSGTTTLNVGNWGSGGAGVKMSFAQPGGGLDLNYGYLSGAYITISPWKINTGGSSNYLGLPINRLFGATQGRYGVTRINVAGSLHNLFDGFYELPVTIAAGDTGTVEIDFNPQVGWTANTASGFTYMEGAIAINFYYVSYAKYVKVEMYRYSGGADGWQTIYETSTNNKNPLIIPTPPAFNYVKKLRFTFANANDPSGIWLTELEWFPTRERSSDQLAVIPKYYPRNVDISMPELRMRSSANWANITAKITNTGDVMGTRLCIGADCRASWPEAVNAFVDEGNVGFGPIAVLGTKDEATGVPLSFITDGIERMRLDTAGNVGIGTTNPESKLHIMGADVGRAPFGAALVAIENTSGPYFQFLSGNATQAGFIFGDTDDATVGGFEYNHVTNNLDFKTDDWITRLTLQSGGNVGIGTTAPGQLFALEKLSGDNAELSIKSVAGANTHWGIYQDRGTSQLRFWQGDNRVVITAAGDVGIGKSVPGTTLDVNGVINAATGFRMAGVAAAGNYLRGNGTNFVSSAIQAGDLPSGSNQYIWNATTQQPSSNFNISGNGIIGGNLTVDNSVLFVDAATDRAGVGTTAPGQLFALEKLSGDNAELSIKSVAGANTHWGIYQDRGTSQLRFWQGDNRVVITAAGDVGIGTVAPAYKLDVRGRVNASTSSPIAISGASFASDGQAVYGFASDSSATNFGGYFQANGATGRGVFGSAANSGAVINYGGYFEAAGTGFGAAGVYAEATGAGIVGGVYGKASNSTAVNNVGGYFEAAGTGPESTGVWGSAPSRGVYGEAKATTGINYGVYGKVISSSGWAGYFTGGQGAYADKLALGSVVDPSPYQLRVAGNGYITNDLEVKNRMALAEAPIVNSRVLNIQATASSTVPVSGIYTQINNPAGSQPSYLRNISSFIFNFDSSGSMYGTTGIESEVNHQGSGTAALTYGFQSRVFTGGTGTITNAYGFQGVADPGTAGTVTNAYGVAGRTGPSSENSKGKVTNAYGVLGEAGVLLPTASMSSVNTAYGVAGYVKKAAGTVGTGYGGYFESRNANTNYGIYATASGGTTNWAGYFVGGQGVYVGNNLVVGGGSFIVYRCNDGTANEGRMIVDYGGNEARTFCGGADTFSDTGLRVK